MLTPVRDKIEGIRHLWPRRFQKVVEGKTSYGLSWRVKMMSWVLASATNSEYTAVEISNQYTGVHCF